MPTNYEELMSNMTPEAEAFLLSQAIYVNPCSVCPRDTSNCDCHCETNILSWLKSPMDEKVVKLVDSLKIAEDILL